MNIEFIKFTYFSSFWSAALNSNEKTQLPRKVRTSVQQSQKIIRRKKQISSKARPLSSPLQVPILQYHCRYHPRCKCQWYFRSQPRKFRISSTLRLPRNKIYLRQFFPTSLPPFSLLVCKR